MTRIDRCAIFIDGYVEFEGQIHIDFDLPPDDPLVTALLERNEQQLLAAAQKEANQG